MSFLIYTQSDILPPPLSPLPSLIALLREICNLNIRPRLQHILRRLIPILFEILHKQLPQLGDLGPEIRRARPALPGIEQLVRDTRARRGNMEVESLVDLVLALGQRAGMDGVEDRARVFQRAAFPARGGAGADPARVEQPRVRLVLVDFVREHARVAHRVQGEERLGEARGKRGLGLGDAVLGAGHLGRVAGDEVEHGLLGRKLADGGQDTTGVAC